MEKLTFWSTRIISALSVDYMMTIIHRPDEDLVNESQISSVRYRTDTMRCAYITIAFCYLEHGIAMQHEPVCTVISTSRQALT